MCKCEIEPGLSGPKSNLLPTNPPLYQHFYTAMFVIVTISSRLSGQSSDSIKALNIDDCSMTMKGSTQLIHDMLTERVLSG